MSKAKYARQERWYGVKDYEGRYQVSTQGRVRSLERIDDGGLRRRMRLLSPLKSTNGRCYVTLTKKAVARTFCISALLAAAYGIPNPHGCAYVIHQNHDMRDFRRSNLAWATLAELRVHSGVKISSPYYGVGRTHTRNGTLRWIAQARVDHRRHEFGRFATAEEAAYAYDREVKRRGLSRPLNGLAKPKSYRPKIASLPGEIWRRFPGAEQTHMISNFGRVRTVAHRTRQGVRVLPKLRKITVDAAGCRTILIRGKRYGIATSMARAFSTRTRSHLHRFGSSSEVRTSDVSISASTSPK